MVNIQGACQKPPPSYTLLGGHEGGRRVLLASPPNSPPPQSHDLALPVVAGRAAILALKKTVVGKKAAVSMTVTFSLLKLYSSNSHLSDLLPKTGSPFVSSLLGEEGCGDGKCSSNRRAGRPSLRRKRSKHFFISPTGRKYEGPLTRAN